MRQMPTFGGPRWRGRGGMGASGTREGAHAQAGWSPAAEVRRRIEVARAPRGGAGTLIFVSFMAIVFLCVIGLFQFLGEQVARGQKLANEAIYARYLSDAALSEATAVLNKQINVDGQKITDLFGKTIAVDSTARIAKNILGGSSPKKLEVRLIQDTVAASGDPWAGVADSELAKLAFAGESAGLALLLCELEVGSMKVRATRGFQFRLVSPAPPTGLDKVAFLAHQWQYFQDRVQYNTSELFDLAAQAEVARVMGGMIVEDRRDAYEGSIDMAKWVAALSVALLEASDDTSATPSQAVKNAVSQRCGSNLEKCRGLANKPDPWNKLDFVSSCLYMSKELREAWEAILFNIPKQLQEQGCPQAGQPDTNRTSDTAYVFTKYFDLGGGTCSGVSQLQPAEIETKLKERLYPTSDDAGLWEPPGNGQNFFIAKCGYYLAKGKTDMKPYVEELDRRYTEVGWKPVVETVLKQTLHLNIQSMQQDEFTAGKQLTLGMLLSWSKLETGAPGSSGSGGSGPSLVEQKDKAKAALEKLEISESTDVAPLTYPGFPDVKQGLQTYWNGTPKLADVFTTAAQPGANRMPKLMDDLNKKTTQWVDVVGEYLKKEEVRNITRGPVYIPGESGLEITQERLEYLSLPSPTKTDMKKNFPLAWAPWWEEGDTAPTLGGSYGGLPEPKAWKLKREHRGFLTVHGNWSKVLGGSGGGGQKYEPDYKPTPELLKQLKDTAADVVANPSAEPDGIALRVASAWGSKDPTQGFSSEVQTMVQKMMEGDNARFLQLKPFNQSLEFYDGNSMMAQKDKGMDGDAIEEWAKGWSGRFDEFKKVLEATHQKHQNPPFKAWPKEPPDPELSSTAGWKTPFDESKGQEYVGVCLKPDVNKKRAAFRFKTWADFQTFLVSTDYAVEGVYFIDQADATISLGGKVLQGSAYLVFPGPVKIQGEMASSGGPLVLVAQGVTLEGSGTVFKGIILSNGEFTSENGSIEGSLVTTGTPSDTVNAPQPNYNSVDEYKQAIQGKLKPVTIKYKSAYEGTTATNRKDFLRLIMSPFRVAQDFEVRREATN